MLREYDAIPVWPASHYVTEKPKVTAALRSIEEECERRVSELKAADKLLEAQRLQQRTDYDLEMLETMGFCTGIENYSRHLDGRKPGEPPFTLIDYFPKDMLCHGASDSRYARGRPVAQGHPGGARLSPSLGA